MAWARRVRRAAGPGSSTWNVCDLRLPNAPAEREWRLDPHADSGTRTDRCRCSQLGGDAMMPLHAVSIRDVRCITHAELEISPGLKLVWVDNGLGKTSILEAIFLLGRGRSFCD